MNTQTHRTCIRMSQEEYDLLKEKSRAAGLSANAWLMRELERNRPILYREKETRAAIAFADEAGRDINAVARAFNSGSGTAQHLELALHRLAQVVERVWGRGRDRLPFALRWGLTFLFVNIAWVFFRAPDCAGALELLGRAVTGGFAKPAAWLLEGLFAEETSAVQMLIPAFTPWKNILRVVLLYGAGMVAVLWPRNTIRRMEDFRPTLWRGAALTVLTLWCVLSFTGVTTFIYSNF